MSDATPCIVEGCPNLGTGGRGWCSTHYSRWRRYGDTGSGEIAHKNPLPDYCCEQCGETFRPQRRGDRVSRWCSRACHASSLTIVPAPSAKACLHCGSAFSRRKGEGPSNFIKRATCSDLCRQALAAEKRSDRDPHPGVRPLVAKTCTICGRLKMADAFYLRNTGRRASQCGECLTSLSVDWFKKAQGESSGDARSRGDYWTGADLEIVARDDLTQIQIAAMLGRTVAGVRYARSLLANDPRRQRVAGI